MSHLDMKRAHYDCYAMKSKSRTDFFHPNKTSTHQNGLFKNIYIPQKFRKSEIRPVLFANGYGMYCNYEM